MDGIRLRPAVFLDRDGTLNVECSYLTTPEQMQLLPGAADAVRQLKAAGYVCVVVTNQSAVGRGMMTEADLDRVHAEMNRQLAAGGAILDAIYHSPHRSASPDPLVIDHPDRKPAPGLLLRAAADLQLDLANSWMIGDSLRDILAGQNAGCRACILVRTGNPIDEPQFNLAKPFEVAADLLAAVQHILTHHSPLTTHHSPLTTHHPTIPE
jgi:D-glycero-D-manno-heptose 1,7-bisphosphate phosphatase